MDIGEWNNNNILIDVREYIKYCVMPYLKSSNLIGRKITLSISLDILNALLFQLTPMLPPADVSWLMKSNPFSLLKSIVSLFNRRKEMFSLVINKIDNIYIVSKKLIEILAGCISSLPEDYVQYSKFLFYNTLFKAFTVGIFNIAFFRYSQFRYLFGSSVL